MRVFYWQLAYKPGSVVYSHLSSSYVAVRVKRITIDADGPPICINLLAANRVYLPPASPQSAVSSYLTPFTLTYQKGRRYRFCGTFPRVAPGRR